MRRSCTAPAELADGERLGERRKVRPLAGMSQCSGMTPERRTVDLRRWLDDFRDDPAMLADLAVADESQLLVGRQGAVEEETGRNRTRVLRITLDRAAAGACDQIERSGERRRGDSLAPMP